MEEITKNTVRGDMIPVLLGLSSKALEKARELAQRCDSVSHIFCSRVPLLFRFSIYMRFHRINRTHKERLMLQALLDFSDQMKDRDTILYLVPCTREYTAMVQRNRALLESRFVIAEPLVGTRRQPFQTVQEEGVGI